MSDYVLQLEHDIDDLRAQLAAAIQERDSLIQSTEVLNDLWQDEEKKRTALLAENAALRDGIWERLNCGESGPMECEPNVQRGCSGRYWCKKLLEAPLTVAYVARNKALEAVARVAAREVLLVQIGLCKALDALDALSALGAEGRE